MRIRLFIYAALLPVCTLGVREAFSHDQTSESTARENVAVVSVPIDAQGLVNFIGPAHRTSESIISAVDSGPSSATGSNQVAQRDEEERRRLEELRRHEEEEHRRLEDLRRHEEERKREEERRREQEGRR
jgi:hypothetical protein